MLRLLPVILLVLQAIPFSSTVYESHSDVEITQKMSCCGGNCRCAENGCKCGKKEDKAPAKSKTPFTIDSIDFTAPLTATKYSIPNLTSTGEIKVIASTVSIVASNNCRQALLGRWQN
ncbi:MAG: hypothetical protein QF718_08655 [Phycisphaerales bacterium]|jgi:hypothetical protein|nr:hypothetical protein [Phycisphaerales bacterium]